MAVTYYFAPSWFITFGIVFEALFAIILITISLTAYRFYQVSKQYKLKLFSLAFGSIALYYIIKSLINANLIASENISRAQLLDLGQLSLAAHIFFMLAGLIILLYISLNLKNNRLFSLLILIIFVTAFVSRNNITIFYVISTILLAYITLHYYEIYKKKPQHNTLLVCIAFLLLLLANLDFILTSVHSIFYVLGHFIEFTSYLLFLINLILVFKK
ncbi:hypothetical protein J4471_01870 [Candidatus Woesearchaeota archaeon]|nr:hypothetical protein [Candidatus Woesearchaeota archaeon]